MDAALFSPLYMMSQEAEKDSLKTRIDESVEPHDTDHCTALN